MIDKAALGDIDAGEVDDATTCRPRTCESEGWQLNLTSLGRGNGCRTYADYLKKITPLSAKVSTIGRVCLFF